MPYAAQYQIQPKPFSYSKDVPCSTKQYLWILL
jgi:hypothetical protein